ncbi:MAG: glutathione S-transferase family protein [Alphaproteobacteria bacterium]|nr:glutathione S-transferase family protein [Alphaproteobacteria bacterium]MBU1525264.1 glutathione S-transferase family protein [Alphaproteobacteria bacterium]MBU2351182.1 glutathione S-transferase family protein [Alphaproteobacteria bacterium]MBU2382642.1 glutathione S-transferase family protein [Alphaproteobacteria bacterium]
MTSGVLHHFAFDPASRAARLALGEAGVAFEENPVRPWEPDCVIRGLNPSGMPPVFVTTERERPLTLCELPAILGWIEDQAAAPVLLPTDPIERAEARRLVHGFERRFNDEVDAVLLHERLEKPLLRLGPPEARALREGRENLKIHLAALEDLLARRDCLAGRRLSQADLVAAAHLSVLDFFGEVSWGNWPALKTWYMRLKSRPSFRPLLTDRLAGLQAAQHYADLDF